MNRDGTYRKIKFAENSQIFRCPICKDEMSVYELKDMVCNQGHNFNIARKGYINFLLKAVKTDYDEDMFYSRTQVQESGFFDPLLEFISGSIIKRIEKNDLRKLNILDAGCGQGSHIGQIISNLEEKVDKDIRGFGVDISKEGIVIASKQSFDILWCVADLTNLPFASRGFDVILNILSPANYDEFHRVLKDEGILIKVVPGSAYLKELRSIFYKGTDKEEYSNEQVVKHYSKEFEIIDTSQLKYNHSIDKDELIHFIRMTPLSWKVTDDKIQRIMDIDIDNISAEFLIIMGKKKNKNMSRE